MCESPWDLTGEYITLEERPSQRAATSLWMRRNCSLQFIVRWQLVARVIGMAFQDRECPINLLEQHHPRQLVG